VISATAADCFVSIRLNGKLSALRYPEREIVSVPARKVYCDPGHRFAPPGDEAS